MNKDQRHRLALLWKLHPHTADDDLQDQITVIRETLERVDDAASQVFPGAHIHLLRTTNQSIPVGGAAISWESEHAILPRKNFAAVSGTDKVIQEPGYYNVDIETIWDTWTGGGSVWVTRTRDGGESTVWPPGTLWQSADGQEGGDVAPAIECLADDIIRVYIDHDTTTAQNLAYASVALYLVDSTREIPPCVPFADWRFNETSGTTAADSIGEHDGTYTGTPTLGLSGPAGGSDKAFATPNVGDYVSIPNHSRFDVTSFTIEVWAKTNITGTGDHPNAPDIVAHGRTSATALNWGVGEPKLYANGELGTAIQHSGGSELGAFVTSGFRDNQYHHIVSTFDGQFLKIYLDGVLRDTADAGNFVTIDTTAGDLEVGRKSHPLAGTDGRFDGEIARVRIRACALDTSEVAAAYEEGSA